MWRTIFLLGLGAWGIVPVCLADLDTSTTPTIPVYLEDSPAAQELVDRAFHLRDQGRLVDASGVMQQVIEQFPQKLMKVAGPRHEDAARWVYRTIRADGPWLEAYRRTYEPEASRALALAREPLPDASAIKEVIRRYLLTPSGLEASLDLAGLWLERGAVDDAAVVLDMVQDHPDLTLQALRQLPLRAAVATMRGDAAGFEAARAELDRLGAGHLADEAALLRTLTLSAEPTPTDEALLPESFDAPLWQVSLLDAPAVDNTVLLRRVPTLADQLVLVNTGVAVLALDRVSGRTVWTTGDIAAGTPDIQAGRFFQSQRLLPDERAVTVWGDRVLAVVGPDMSQMGRRHWWQPATYLVSIDRGSGQTLWRKQPHEFDPTLENAFFHGTPIAGYDRVFVLVRRSQVSGFHDAFVVAVDAASGELVWRRHLSSAASGHRFAARPLAQMTYERGRLFISDNLGVATCLDGRQGDVLWSCLIGETLPAANPRMGWQGNASALPSDPPVLIEAGVVIPPVGAQAPVLLLDVSTGKVLRELDEPAWTQARFLARAGDHILAVGSNVTCFDGKTLEIRWVHEGDDTPTARPIVVGDTLIVPRNNRLVVLDMKTGRLQADRRNAPIVSLLVDDGQVIQSTHSAVSSYMPWDLAYASLRKRMETEPAEPSSGIALAHVAVAMDKPDALLEGVDHALTALRRGGPHVSEPQRRRADEVFAQVLSFTSASRVSDPDLRRKLFARIGTATTTASDEVAYRMALARFEIEVGQFEAAVDHYQSILLDDTLSSQLHSEEGAVRQAWMEARRQLASLVDKHGPAIYARHEAAAAVRLQELLTLHSGDPVMLQDMARRYPLARAGTQALIAAASARTAQGDLDAALPLLRQAYRQARRDTALAGEAVGRLAQLSLQLDRPRIAQRWLEVAARQHPGIEPWRDGRPTPVDQLLAELTLITGSHQAMPSLGSKLGPARLMDGRLLQWTRPPRDSLGFDRLMLQQQASVSLHHGPDLTRRWAAQLAAEEPVELLWLDEEQVIVWSAAAGRVVCLDAATGKRRQQDLELAPLLASAGDPRQRAEQQQSPEILRELIEQPVIVRRGGVLRVVDPATVMLGENGPATYAAANEWVIVIADELGRVVCLDRRDGQTLWRLLAPMQRIASILLDDDSLVLSGVTDPGTDAQGGMVMVLDASTGERRCPTIEVKDPLQFVGLSDSLVVYATANEAAGHHVNDGAVAWRLGMEDRTLSGQGWLDGELLVLAESGPTPGLVLLRAADGHVHRRLVGSELGMDEPIDLRKAADHWHIRGSRRLMVLDETGQTRWRDAVAEEGLRFTHQFLSEQIVVAVGTDEAIDGAAAARRPLLRPMAIEGRDLNVQIELRLRVMQAEVAAAEVAAAEVAAAAVEDADVIQPRSYVVYVFDREGGRLLAEHQLGPLPGALNTQAAYVLDGRIAIGAGDKTLILDASP